MAPQRCPVSWATSDSAVFSPLTRWLGSAGYFVSVSISTTLASRPPLPYSAARSTLLCPMPRIWFLTVLSKAKVSASVTRVSVQNTSWS